MSQDSLFTTIHRVNPSSSLLDNWLESEKEYEKQLRICPKSVDDGLRYITWTQNKAMSRVQSTCDNHQQQRH